MFQGNRPSRFTVSPTPNAKPAATIHSQPSALSIIVNSLHEKDRKTPPIRCGLVNSSHICSASPTDSTDSGVISPGELSPSPAFAHVKRFPLNGTAERSQLQQQRAARPRSNSVNFLNQMENNESMDSSSSVTSINGSTLKGILKKPRAEQRFSLSNGSSSSSGGLRRTTRFVLARSVSECHDEYTAAEAFHGVVLSNFPANEMFGEEEEEEVNNGGSLASVNEEEEQEDDAATPPAMSYQRKKRVSFNEHVQARVYRSNSSILGQKKKNEKKSRSKRRRSESESDAQVSHRTPTEPYSSLNFRMTAKILRRLAQ
jgi:hypothetical protein